VLLLFIFIGHVICLLDFQDKMTLLLKSLFLGSNNLLLKHILCASIFETLFPEFKQKMNVDQLDAKNVEDESTTFNNLIHLSSYEMDISFAHYNLEPFAILILKVDTTEGIKEQLLAVRSWSTEICHIRFTFSFKMNSSIIILHNALGRHKRAINSTVWCEDMLHNNYKKQPWFQVEGLHMDAVLVLSLVRHNHAPCGTTMPIIRTTWKIGRYACLGQATLY
ncbi:hypothetical protein ACJX0J_026293, partial [Zea mays]